MTREVAHSTGRGLVHVTAATVPFAPRRVRVDAPAGTTLRDILRDAGVNPDAWPDTVVTIDGWPVPRENWRVVKPKPGRLVTIHVIAAPHGGDDKLRTGLTIAVIVAAIAVVAFAPYLAPAAIPAWGVALGGGLAAAGISVGGMLAINALVPLKQPRLSTDSGISGSQTLFIEGARNASRQWGPVPVVLGRHRVVPPYGATPYTQISGDNQFLFCLFTWGYGQLEISDLKIGETPIDDYEGVEYETREGTASDDPVTLYTNDVTEQAFSVRLAQSDDWQSRTTETEADEISVDLVAPGGIVKFSQSSGQRKSRTVVVEMRYRQVGEATWLAPTFTETSVDEDLISVGSTETTISLTHARANAIRHGFRWPASERGQYEVAVRRTTADAVSDRIVDEIFWAALRRFKDDDPVSFADPVAVSAVRIKATNQLNRVLDEFNGVAQLVCLDWDSGTSSWVSRATSNPASLFRYVLQMPGLNTPDSSIDLLTLQYWHEFCDTEGFEFNHVVDYDTNVREILTDVCAAGRASPSYNDDGQFTVVIDEVKAVPVQHFTPRNSWGFTAEKGFADPVHAWRVRFVDASAGWAQAERIVYADGYAAEADESAGLEAATVYETMELIGTTSSDQAWKLARHHDAVSKQRPERWLLSCDFEHLVSRRGDLVVITHDVLLVGLASGRITSMTVDGSDNVTSITVDETLTMELGKSYGLSIRTVADARLLVPIDTDEGDQITVIPTTPIPAANAPSVGDLFGFGEAGLETVEALVTRVERGADITARLTCVPYAAAMYDAADGAIPAYDPGITPVYRVPVPVLVNVEPGVIERVGSTATVRILFSVEPLEVEGARLDVQLRSTDTGEAYYGAEALARTDVSVTIGDVIVGEVYDFRLRWVVGDLLPGAWLTITAVTPVGITGSGGSQAPLTAIQGLTVSAIGGFALLRWERPDEIEALFGASVRFRHSPQTSGVDWSDSTSIGQAVPAGNLVTSLPLLAGTYFARIFDVYGTPGGIASVTTKQASLLTFGTPTNIDEDPGFSGTHDDTVVDTGTLKLDVGVGGDVLSEGTYDFANSIDLTAVKLVRLTVRLEASSTEIASTIDSRTALIDTWESFDGGASQAVADAEIWVRHTDDDPAGTPSWSTWERLHSAEFEARAFEFQARLKSTDPAYNIVISDLGITAEEIV